MHASHRRRLVVDRAQQPRREMAIVDYLLLPLASQSRVDGIGSAGYVLGIDVPADAERIKVTKAPFAGAGQARRGEGAVPGAKDAVGKDDVGDDLWPGRALLDLAPWPEAVVRPHAHQQVIQSSGAKPRPLTAGKQKVPGDDQDILARTHGKSLVWLMPASYLLLVVSGRVRGRRWPRDRRGLGRRRGFQLGFGRGLRGCPRGAVLADHAGRLGGGGLRLIDP